MTEEAIATTEMSSTTASSPLLERVYTDLDLYGGTLLEATETPGVGPDDQRWAELGDWLLLAARVHAERVFFLNDDPVLVFSSLPAESEEDAVLDCYRRTWSLARPRCLFLAIGDELRVYSLATPPTSPDGVGAALTPLQVVTRVADVAGQLADFHRERLESGVAFEFSNTFDSRGRADQQLLHDVRAVTEDLVDAEVPRDLAHALIERAILVRYLEDRQIIGQQYFDDILKRHPEAAGSFDGESRMNFGQQSRFLTLLSSKDVTYDLFDQLAEDFNGDLFLTGSDERQVVTIDQLTLLKNLLQGSATTHQEPLFLWAYDFSVIPTNLISTMYELFHQEEVAESVSGTYYTPPELVEFVLAEVLPPEKLNQSPTVCDPSCGSGIFLVEAYRRIVRHEMIRSGQSLSTARLREILLKRIAGCDIDEAAIRLAAFSLYIAFLNYQSPHDIREAGPLPRLIHRNDEDHHTAPLIVNDAFSPMKDEAQANHERTLTLGSNLPWDTHYFDVVVGNPPWTELRGPRLPAEQWASDHFLPVGDRNPSQLFLWRVLDLLTEDGVAALLIGATTMLNARSTTRAFRAQWLESVRLARIVNFSDVRRDFFETAVAPFMLVCFGRRRDELPGAVIYETAHRVPLGRRGSAALARLDRQVVRQSSLRSRDYLWKTYSAGSFRDEAFLARLEGEDRLGELTEGCPRAYGFQRASDARSGYQPPRELQTLRILRTFRSWGPLDEDDFESIPPYVTRVPDLKVFDGLRLLVRLGVSTGFGPHARIETEPLAFRHTTYAFSLDHLPVWQAITVLGALLSSLGRYWLYMTSGSWGTWKDKIRLDDLLKLPVRLPSHPNPTTQRIEAAVDALRKEQRPLAANQAHLLLPALREIDECINDLFEVTAVERDLVSDFWANRLPESTDPIAAGKQTNGAQADLETESELGLVPYLRVLVGTWNQRLGGRGEFTWRLWKDPNSGVLAVVLQPRNAVGSLLDSEEENQETWLTALHRIGVSWDTRESRAILRYGIVRAVTDTAIVIVKRDERRLWTSTAAWLDADATAAQLMSMQR